MLRRFLPLAVALAGMFALAGMAGCVAETETGDDAELKETLSVFGDDRLIDKLRGKPAVVPATFQDYEKLYKVGRHCARTDSKEIFIVEESSSRVGGRQVYNTNQLLPRAVVTGCNTDSQNPDAVKTSFEMMAALISSPGAANAAKGDPMIFTEVEVMALDRRTGTYNFYVMKPQGAGNPGKLVRVMRMPDGKIKKFEMDSAGKSKVSTAETNACFTCHVNGGPLMNEMVKPWTNWVSVLNQLPHGKLSGETQSMVGEAAAGPSSRSSFANDLEQIMKAAMRVWVDGNMTTTGFGQMTIEGTMPGGLGHLLKSSFCETELQYTSSHDTEPFELFVDTDAASYGQVSLQEPAFTPEVSVNLMPIRSEHDRRTEKHMIKRKYLTISTVLAIRLLDDERDVFAPLRCGLLAEVVAAVGKPTKPEDANARIASLLNGKAKANKLGTMSKARRDYITALTDPKATPDALDKAKLAWQADFQARFDKLVAGMTTDVGAAALAKRAKERKVAATKMFPGATTPLPLLD
ncbi:MAG: hypothetical protein EXR79_06065 [Myxococcales bacterium]|nr:hypothetical protein [Myxococcales bacterium]